MIAKKVEQAAEAWLALAMVIRKLKDGHEVEPTTAANDPGPLPDFLNRAKIAAKAATP